MSSPLVKVDSRGATQEYHSFDFLSTSTNVGAGFIRPGKSTIIPGIVLYVLALFFALPAMANDLALSVPSLVNPQATTKDIQFTVAWNNSWCDNNAACNGDAQHADANWDAVWLFAKFSKWQASTSSWSDWAHCTLSKTAGDHHAPAGSQIKVGCSSSAACGGSDTGKGLFIYRNAAGSGNNSWAGVWLRWLFTLDGVAPADIVKVRIFGIEMVYIPQGPFTVGSGGTEDGTFTDGAWSGTNGVTASIPFIISSENTLTIAHTAGSLWGTSTSGNNSIGGAGTLPAVFPKGYGAFYIMKYDVTQGLYRDFLNLLTLTQQKNHIYDTPPVAGYYTMTETTTIQYRSGIRNPSPLPVSGAITFGCDLQGATAHNSVTGDGVFNGTTDGEWVGANYLSWADLTAFADWAALRPFSELEYEKAARGPQVPVANAYAWGNATVSTQTGAMISSGTTNETVPQGNANYAGALTQGPFRAGIFATSTSTTRTLSGASYYGVMDMSGGLWKRPVSVGEATVGRLFNGTISGDGSLDVNGYADASTWPGTNAVGSGFRGGTWSNAASVARVSGRSYAALVDSNRYSDYGARCARASP
jgi:formylglycine-generating enzyme required for sulfatase activity